MLERKFNEVFDTAIFAGSTILIDEDTSQCCDFFILELIRELKYSLFRWNDSTETFAMILKKCNVDGDVRSIYTTEYNSEDILDDVYVQRKIGHANMAKVGVFRSSTATLRDYYDYDIVVKIERLISGLSSKIDGSIRMFKRESVYCNVKYKIYEDRIAYYE